MPICRTCKKDKPRSEFYVKNDNVSGYDHACKVCRRAKSKLARERRKPDAEPPDFDGYWEFRRAVMDTDVPIWHAKIRLIKEHGLNMDREADTPKIVRLLEKHEVN